MRRAELIAKILKTKRKKEHLALFKKHGEILDPEFARALKNTYYDSWTKDPQKTRNAATALQILTEILPGEEIKALAAWVCGIADLTEGKLEKTIANLDEAARIFRKIDKEHDAAQTQVAKLIALALLGKYDEAIRTGKDALRIFEKFGDRLAAGKIEKNLGNIVARQGDEKQAEKFYLAARRRFVEIGDTCELAMSDNSLANTYAELNDFRKAEKFYALALDNARKAKMFVTEAEIEASMGNLATFRGRYSDALRFLELSRQKYKELKMPHQTAIAELEIADIYLELNLAKEAFEIYEKTAERLKKLKLQGEQARARANFGRAAIVLREYKTARKQLNAAARLYESEGNKTGAAFVKITQANLELALENYESVLKIAREAEKLLETGKNIRYKLAARWFEGEALRCAGTLAEAEKILSETYARASRQEQKSIAQASLNSLGKLFLQKGDAHQAKKYFKKSVKLVESLRAPLAAEEFRMAFLAGKLSPFEFLAKIYLSENDLKNAFLMTERARSRALIDALQNDFQTGSSEIASPELVKKLETLREELNWFYSRQSRAEETEIARLQKEAKQREKLIADAMRQIESVKSGNKSAENKSFSDKKDSVFLDFKLLQKNLAREKVLIEFINSGGKFSAFAVSDKKLDFVAEIATETEIIALLENLHFQFAALRYGAKIPEKFASELKRRADFYLQKLYEKLFLPLEKFAGEKNLLIVPAGLLHYVPFQALRASEKYLIETREISYAPSASVWNFLQRKKRKKQQNVLLFGAPDERIPLVESEIETLKTIFPEARVFSGDRATVSAFAENAGKSDVLHLACHGQFRPENPLFSSLHLADGWITVRDVCAGKLNAELVTLSACETGLNKVFAGEEILGLARGFLAAGARSLVLSLWTVNDAATTILMKDFYEHLQRGQTIAASLRAAQKNFIKRNEHPYFWSPFALIGR
jgi:CHAT domain-containing protein/tetratricopeptide (TPR) repeat protein